MIFLNRLDGILAGRKLSLIHNSLIHKYDALILGGGACRVGLWRHRSRATETLESRSSSMPSDWGRRSLFPAAGAAISPTSTARRITLFEQPHFAKSALARYIRRTLSPWSKSRIPIRETLGQLFCGSLRSDILSMLG